MFGFNISFLWVEALLLICSIHFHDSFWLSFVEPASTIPHISSFVSHLTHAMPSIFFFFSSPLSLLLLLPCMFAWFPFFISVDYFVSVELFCFSYFPFFFLCFSFIVIYFDNFFFHSICCLYTDTGACCLNYTTTLISVLRGKTEKKEKKTFRFVIRPFIINFVIGLVGYFGTLMTYTMNGFRKYTFISMEKSQCYVQIFDQFFLFK